MKQPLAAQRVNAPFGLLLSAASKQPARTRCNPGVNSREWTFPMNQRMLSNNDAVIGGSLRAMSDELLVVAAQDGNINAFAELRDRHFRTLLRTAYRITRNWEDAEDALQESFLKAFIHLNSFEGRSTFSSWVTRIAINQSLMSLRKRRTINHQSIGAGDDCSGSNDRWEVRDVRKDPEQLYVRHDSSELLRGAIRRLRPCLRNALELDRKSTRLNSSHSRRSRMPSSA